MEELGYQEKLDEMLQAIVKGVRVGIKLGEDPEDIDAAMSRIYPHVLVLSWYNAENLEHVAVMGEGLRLFSEDPEKYIDVDTLVVAGD